MGSPKSDRGGNRLGLKEVQSRSSHKRRTPGDELGVAAEACDCIARVLINAGKAPRIGDGSIDGLRGVKTTMVGLTSPANHISAATACRREQNSPRPHKIEIIQTPDRSR